MAKCWLHPGSGYNCCLSEEAYNKTIKDTNNPNYFRPNHKNYGKDLSKIIEINRVGNKDDIPTFEIKEM